MCEFCKEVSQGCCSAKSPKDYYRCTRPLGHTGPHVACGIQNHRLDTWENLVDDNIFVCFPKIGGVVVIED